MVDCRGDSPKSVSARFRSPDWRFAQQAAQEANLAGVEHFVVGTEDQGTQFVGIDRVGLIDRLAQGIGAPTLPKEAQPVLGHCQMGNLPGDVCGALLRHGEPLGVVVILKETERVGASEGDLFDGEFQRRIHVGRFRVGPRA
mgnify:CR=1 FL=1